MIVIIGAGITGLVLGHYLQKAGKDFRILEASQRSGGNMQTQQIGPYLLEAGPNSLIMNDAFFALLQELNLEKEIQYADPQAKNRYVLRGGQYKKLPAGPPSLIFSKTFSLQAKRQILGERHKKAQHIPDESVDHFFRRRLGDEITDYAVYPFISGIYAGDPKQLLIAEAFPQLTEWEKDFGSILKGFIKGRTPQQHKGTFSFKNGLKSLTERL
ncbi:MAG: protoporphyrinogen oxidase, partial [Bacteroidota bacterium]